MLQYLTEVVIGGISNRQRKILEEEFMCNCGVKIKTGDIWVIHSRLKTLETVRVMDVYEDRVLAYREFNNAWAVNDPILLSVQKTEWMHFIGNEDKRSKFVRCITKVLGWIV